MFQKFCSVLIVFVLFTAVLTMNLFAQFAGGTGTVGDPYLVETPAHLNAVRNYLSSNFRQISNIDLSSYSSGEGWIPIGDDISPFVGKYVGDSYSISNLTINRSAKTDNYTGLFGYLNNAEIIDVELNVNEVNGNDYTGGLAGFIYESTISGCIVTGTLTGTDYVGGICGQTRNSSQINNSWTNASISGEYAVGGIVGYLYDNSTVTGCHNLGNISGDEKTGGIAGYNQENIITNCYNTGDITSLKEFGGIAGHNTGDLVNSFYDFENVLINSSNIITAGALYNTQYQDWQSSSMNLDINSYYSNDGTNYLVSSVQDFKNMLMFSYKDDYSFKLTADLDFSTKSNFYVPFFKGSFDGNNHSISNITVNLPAADYIGLFGLVDDAVIKNTALVNASITGNKNVGGFAGTITDSEISGCSITGTLTSSGNYIGGIAGECGNSNITECINESTVNCNVLDGGYQGGIAGYCHTNSAISKCLNSGNLTGTNSNNYAGGITGRNYSYVDISQCINTGTISGALYIGGITGRHNSNSSINNCYNSGNIDGTMEIGGIAGINQDSEIINCFSYGIITGTNDFGGICGENASGGAVTNTYWDTEASQVSSSEGGTGYTTSNMTYPYDAAVYDSWNFPDTWKADYFDIHNSGYPYLAWETKDDVFEGGSGTEEDPYVVSTAAQLDSVRNYDTLYFIQSEDIDLSSYTKGEGWIPFPTFWGSYNGNGHTIDNLFINRPDDDDQGLIASLNGDISNLTITNADITCDDNGGILAGNSETFQKTIENVTVSGTITADRYIGFLLGRAKNVEINNCSVSGTIDASKYLGGITSIASSTSIDNCINTGNILGLSRAGGIVAYVNSGTVSITNCYNTGNITGSYSVGGIVGFHTLGTIDNCYYDYETVLINGENSIGLGAVTNTQFQDWLNNGMSINIDDYLTSTKGVYSISDINDLKNMLPFGYGEDYRFRLENDIDLTSAQDFYIPLLMGEFDGNHKKITNLNIDKDFLSQIGIFGSIKNGELKNLKITGNLAGCDYIGGASGFTSYSKLYNVSFEGIIDGENFISGFAGYNLGSEIKQCRSNADITAQGVSGGFATFATSDSKIDSCYSEGSLNALYDYIGGFISAVESGTEIKNCYSTVGVQGRSYIAGFAARNTGGTIINSYSTGSVTGTSDVSGFTSENTGTVTHCYWDTETSGQTTSAAGTGKTTDEMTYPYSGTVYEGWDVSSVWTNDNLSLFNNGYPFLKWEIGEEIFSGGTGTEEDPYIVTTHQELNNIRYFKLSYYKQEGDIDLSSYTKGEGWVPIGSLNDKFFGGYDGNGNTIDNLFINTPADDNIGLFGFLYDAEIKNLQITNADITGDDNVSILSGQISGSSVIENISVDGTINADGMIGGICGDYYGSEIRNCTTSGTYNGTERIGGITGYNRYGIISDCINSADISCNAYAGGICGVLYNSESEIIDSYNLGSITANYSAGGIVGRITYGSVNNSFYDYETITINGGHNITIGALTGTQFQDWLTSSFSLNPNDYLNSSGGYYTISNTTDITNMLPFVYDETLSFKLQNNIDMSGKANLYIPYFSGTFEGNSKKIENLTVNIEESSHLGFFGHIDNGTVKNLNVEGDITGRDNLGGIAGSAMSAEIIKTSFSGSAEGENNVGGIIGLCVSTDIGGSFSDVNLDGYSNVGGLAGLAESTSKIDSSFCKGSIEAVYDRIGGAVGSIDYSSIKNSYSLCTVNGRNYVGGFIGYNYFSDAENCYSIGSALGTTDVGGFIGHSNETSGITGCYWDTETSGLGTSQGGEGKTTDEMTYPYTGGAYSGWSFPAIWKEDVYGSGNNGYPYLAWQNIDNKIVITELLPAGQNINIDETDSVEFSVSAFDPDGNTLEYQWLLDGTEVSAENTYIYRSDYSSAASSPFTVTLNITDNFSVRKNQINTSEGNLISYETDVNNKNLMLRNNFEQNSISDNNELSGSSEYLKNSAKNDTSFTWQITVNDVDQIIVITDISPAPGNISVKESETVEFSVTAQDPDGNPLEYSWKLDDTEVSSTSEYDFITDYTSSDDSPYALNLDITDNYSKKRKFIFLDDPNLNIYLKENGFKSEKMSYKSNEKQISDLKQNVLKLDAESSAAEKEHYTNINKLNYIISNNFLQKSEFLKNHIKNDTLFSWNITVIDNQPPVFDETSYSFAVQENIGVGSSVGTVSASDPDDDNIAYSISGTGSGDFSINSGTGEITTAAEINFEAEDQYNLTVTADDGVPGNAADVSLTITVSNENEAPQFTEDSYTFSIQENSAAGTAVGSLTAVDEDDNASITFIIKEGNNNNAFDLYETKSNKKINLKNSSSENIHFLEKNKISGEEYPENKNINSQEETNDSLTLNKGISSTVEIRVNNPSALDYETVQTFTLLVKAEDNGKGMYSEVSVTINITNEVELPQFVDTPYEFTISENSETGTVLGTVQANGDQNSDITYSLTDDADGKFLINSETGVVTNNYQFDFETDPASYTLTVQADDGVKGISQTEISVTLLNENEAPQFTEDSYTFTVQENSPQGTVVGTVNVVDEDNVSTINFIIKEGNTDNTFGFADKKTGEESSNSLLSSDMISIHKGVSESAEIIVSNPNGLDFEINPVFSLIIKAEDNGKGMYSEVPVTINLTNEVEAPEFLNTPYEFSLEENAAVGTIVGTVSAVGDQNSEVEYSLTEDGAGRFTIDSETGELKSSYIFDYETDQLDYVLTVKADDGIQTFSTENINVSITNGDDEIVITNFIPAISDSTISEGDSVLFSVTAFDPDGNDLDYQWFVNDSEVIGNSEYIFYTDFSSSENSPYIVKTVITDNFGSKGMINKDSKIIEWTITVENVVQDADISGSVSYFAGGTMLFGVVVTADDGESQYTSNTDISGTYIIEDLQPGSYDVSADVDDNSISGINALDYIMIKKHALGISTIEQGTNTYTAADVTGEGSVNALDYIKIKRKILGLDSDFPIGNWKFVPGIAEIDLQADTTDIDFIGIKIGDVNGSFNGFSKDK